MTTTKKNANVTNSNSLKDIFGSDFQPLNNITKMKKNYKISDKSCALTIINTAKHGKRILIRPDVIEQIGSPDHIHVGLTSSGIILGIIEGALTFKLKDTSHKKVIYSVDLVNKLTEEYNLNFSGTTSLSYQNVTYNTVGSHVFAYIKLCKHTKNNIAVGAVLHLEADEVEDNSDIDLDDSDNTDDTDLDLDDSDGTDDSDLDLDDSDDTDDSDIDLDDSDDTDNMDLDLDDSDGTDDMDLDLDDSDGTDDMDLDLDDSDGTDDMDLDLDDSDGTDDMDLDLDDTDDFADTSASRKPSPFKKKRRRKFAQ
jgi:hypothetical protein